jgi:hypothetical protein
MLSLLVLSMLASGAWARQSEECAAQSEAWAVVDREIAKELKDDFGNRSTLEVCVTNADAGAGPEQTKTFLQCAGISCFVLGLDRCEAAGGQVLTMVLAGMRAKDERKRLGCP